MRHLLVPRAPARSHTTSELTQPQSKRKNTKPTANALAHLPCPAMRAGLDTPLEDIFYHHLRCQLVHEGVMPETISFTETREEHGKKYNVLKLENPLGFPITWVETLATAIWLAPESDDLWQDDEERRTHARKGFGDKWERHRFCRRPNQQSKEMKRRRERMKWDHLGKQFVLTSPPGTTTFEVIAAIEAKAKELTP